MGYAALTVLLVQLHAAAAAPRQLQFLYDFYDDDEVEDGSCAFLPPP